MIKIEKSNQNALFKTLSNLMPLYLPIKKAGEVNYGLFEENAEVSYQTLKTVKSAKDLFFPQSQDMMAFKMQGKNIEIIDVRKQEQPFIIFGVKGCDLKSFEILDKVFLSDPVDTYYKAKREAGIIFTLACSRPEESCFCSVFGIDASEPKGDATCFVDNKNIYIQANTQKGQKVVDGIKHLGQEVDKNCVEEIKNSIKEIIKKLPFTNLDLKRFKPENLNDIFNDSIIEIIST